MMSSYRSDVRHALAERVARAPRVIDLDRSEWEEVRSVAIDAELHRLQADRFGTACLLAALFVFAIVLTPAVEAVAARLW